ncbi:MAG TPA: PRC-barrel domain-containing protein [Phycisphaerae bacterium]|nr:PRC-barrel domain-containing protein [Phycisphaerae bacterium]
MFKRTSQDIKWVVAIAGTFSLTASVVGQETVTKVTVYRSGDDFGMATRWEKTSSVVGRKVVTTTHEDIGKVEDVVVDPRSGRILYGVVSFHPTVGVGEKLYPIPWDSLEMPADNSTVVLKVERDRLRNAPSFVRTEWPNLTDEKYVTTTYRYYNVPTYWETDRRTTRLVSERTTDGDVKIYRERWYSPPRTAYRTTQLVGRTVRNRQNEDLGRVTDISIDPDTGRILYAVIDSNGRYYSIPWPAFIETSDNSYLILDADKDLLTEQVSFTADRWPNMADEQWATTTYRYYRVKPYWTKVEYDDDEIEIKRSDGKEIEIERDDDDDDD